MDEEGTHHLFGHIGAKPRFAPPFSDNMAQVDLQTPVSGQYGAIRRLIRANQACDYS
jgi:hypothetical protein